MLSNLPPGCTDRDIERQCEVHCMECGRVIPDAADGQEVCVKCGEKEDREPEIQDSTYD